MRPVIPAELNVSFLLLDAATSTLGIDSEAAIPARAGETHAEAHGGRACCLAVDAANVRS
ncbi:hypothetical protein BZM27_51380 [Paraburkholderia steynii]|uniref:Uncharacterized protein n=1 Tax=Paraburkholderia steynii TaxID=1245441 RepID=A0A4R0WZR6_9BURK|nr:hypothetical protein BZM27_51380 [Paraburkholderia steynii]